ncbi:insulinase family protein [bacterium]|nr:insulinase family protein [bacterium]
MNIRNFVRTWILLTGLLSLPLFGIDDLKVNEHILDNGLRVITYEMHTAPIIYSRLTYNVGSKYEPHNQTGISHIVEHMMFKGTKRFPKGTIAELISANGGVFNAFTSNDITVYYELLPKNKIELAFDIESQRMYKCDFNPAEFESEIKVIMEERKQRTENRADGKKREELNTLLYKCHPYRNPVIGWMEDIESIARDQAYAHYKKYYTPNNATLVLTGDFDTDEILKTVKEYFGKAPKGPELENPRFFDVEQEGKKILEFKHPDILNESISMYFAAPTRFQEDGAALYVMGNILASRSATSRLNKRLVREGKLCKSTGGGLGFSKDPRPFSIYASLLPEASLEEVEAIIWDEIDSLKNHPVADYDLQKIKNKLAFSEMTGDQYISDVGDRLATYDNYVSWRHINQWDDMVTAVTKDDIMRVSNQYFDEDKMVICYSLPDSSAKVSDSSFEAKPDEEIEDANQESDDIAEPEIDLENDVASKAGLFSRLFGGKEDVRELYKPRLAEILAPNPIAGLVDSFKLVSCHACNDA